MIALKTQQLYPQQHDNQNNYDSQQTDNWAKVVPVRRLWLWECNASTFLNCHLLWTLGNALLLQRKRSGGTLREAQFISVLVKVVVLRAISLDTVSGNEYSGLRARVHALILLNVRADWAFFQTRQAAVKLRTFRKASVVLTGCVAVRVVFGALRHAVRCLRNAVFVRHKGIIAFIQANVASFLILTNVFTQGPQGTARVRVWNVVNWTFGDAGSTVVKALLWRT